MKTARTTADIARELIAATTPVSEQEMSHAKDMRLVAEVARLRGPWVAQEILANQAGEPDSPTRRAAALVMTMLDERPVEQTRYGQVRRQFDDYGSATRRAAREAIDAAEFYGDYKLPEADQHARALNEFAAETNRATGENTLPVGGSIAQPGSDAWSESAASVGDAIVSRGGKDAQ
jgi:hypothetical protein